MNSKIISIIALCIFIPVGAYGGAPLLSGESGGKIDSGISLVIGDGKTIVGLVDKLVLLGKDGAIRDSYRFGRGSLPIWLDRFKDGGGEILSVTVSRDGSLYTYIFRVDGDRLTLTQDMAPYAFRVLKMSQGDLPIIQYSRVGKVFAGHLFKANISDGRVSRGEAIDLPDFPIYSISDIIDDEIWVRKGGRLVLYKKTGEKWKRVFRSRDVYKSASLCFLSGSRGIGIASDSKRICIGTPPVLWSRGKDRLAFLERGELVFGGAFLNPPIVKKSYIPVFNYESSDGPGSIRFCRELGPYDGMITTLEALKDKGGERLVFTRASEDALYLEGLDIASIDCSGKN